MSRTESLECIYISCHIVISIQIYGIEALVGIPGCPTAGVILPILGFGEWYVEVLTSEALGQVDMLKGVQKYDLKGKAQSGS